MTILFIFLIVSLLSTFVLAQMLGAGLIGLAERLPDEAVSAEDEPADDGCSSIELVSELVRYRCGHRYAKLYAHVFYGERVTISKDFLDSRERCGECLLHSVAPFVIRCTVCMRHILPGEAVATYELDTSFPPPAHAVSVGGGKYVGCLRVDCSAHGSCDGIDGYWTKNGFKPLLGLNVAGRTDVAPRD